MNVLFLDQYSALGGGQRCLLDTVEETLARNWAATVALPGDGCFAEALRGMDVDVVSIPCGPYRSERKAAVDVLRFGSDFATQYRLLRGLMRTGRFDLVYVNGPRLLPAAVAAHQAIPILFHAHSLPLQRTAVCAAGVPLTISGAAVVACCRYVADGYERWVSPHSMHVVPNGVPDKRLGVRRGRSGKQYPRIGIVGRIEPAKGQLLLLEAARLVREEVSEYDIQIWGSPGEAGGRYLDQVRHSADGLNVRIMQGDHEISQILGDLDLLVVPSMNEGMPRVILEAFSAEIPVLAFARGGIPEVVVDGENGFLLQDTSAEALARGLLRVLRMPPATLQMIAANARRAWEDQYTSKLFRSRIANLMEETGRSHAGEETRVRRRRTA